MLVLEYVSRDKDVCMCVEVGRKRGVSPRKLRTWRDPRKGKMEQVAWLKYTAMQVGKRQRDAAKPEKDGALSREVQGRGGGRL